MQRLVDGHVHLDMIADHHPDRIGWLIQNGCGVISWSYFEAVDSAAMLQRKMVSKQRLIHTRHTHGLNCRYLAGVHPRSIPADLKPEDVAAIVKPFLEDPLCRGIGEIGLETGTTREREILIAQLECLQSTAREGLVAGVHTPRTDKATITRLTLDILKPFQNLGSIIIVDHSNQDTIGAILGQGFWAGITISPIKTSLDELKAIVAAHPAFIDRIICNTDSGRQFYEDVITCSNDNDIPSDIRNRILADNAARFYQLRQPQDRLQP